MWNTRNALNVKILEFQLVKNENKSVSILFLKISDFEREL